MRIQMVEKANGPERLVCDAELVFENNDGILDGMKMVGFSIWRGAEGDVYVTFPSRAFGTASDRKFFDYLRPVDGSAVSGATTRRVKDAILEAYRQTHAA